MNTQKLSLLLMLGILTMILACGCGQGDGPVAQPPKEGEFKTSEQAAAEGSAKTSRTKEGSSSFGDRN